MYVCMYMYMYMQLHAYVHMSMNICTSNKFICFMITMYVGKNTRPQNARVYNLNVLNLCFSHHSQGSCRETI